MTEIAETKYFLRGDGTSHVAHSDPLAYATYGAKWGAATTGTAGGTVTWSFATANYDGERDTFDSYFTDSAQQAVITAAFDAWEAVANIDFQYSATDSANIDIRIGYKAIDGASSTLAYARSFYSSGSFTESYIVFDSAESYTASATPSGREISLSAVAIHEIGHAIGLSHSDADPAIMQPYYNEGVLTLQTDDIQGARSLYGAADGSGGSGGSGGGSTDSIPGDASTTATLAAGASVTGTIDIGGDTDWYRVSLDAGTSYTIGLTGAPSGNGTLSDPLLRLYDAAGQLVAVDDDGGAGLESLLQTWPTASGTYYLSAEAYGTNTGTYTLSLSASASGGGGGDDYAASASTSGTVSVGGSATGSIETARDQDWFAVQLSAGQAYIITQTGQPSGNGTLSDPYLRVYDAAGSLVGSNDDSGSLDSRLELTASSAGTYYVSAGAYGSATGTYTVSVAAASAGTATDDYASTTATTGRVAAGGSVTGSIEQASDTDWFAIELQAGSEYTFSLTGGSGSGALGDPYFRLYDASGTLVSSDDDGGSGLNSRDVYTATASGTFYASAGAYGSHTGTYTLSVTGGSSDGGAGTAADATALQIGSTASGEIETRGDSDWFSVSLTAGTAYTFDLTGNSSSHGTLSDPLLILRDSTGSEVSRNDDGGSGLESRISYTAQTTGTFYLDAQGFGGWNTGTYRIAATSAGAGDDYLGTSATSGSVSVGGSVTGDVEEAGDTDWFAVSLTAGTTYTINLSGSHSGAGTLRDTYLTLYSGSGAVIERDDDDGPGLESAITYTATTTGTHYLEARGYSTYNTGTYTLAVAAGSDDGGSTGGTGTSGSDDYAASTATTGSVQAGGTASGSIETAQDRDWFAVTLNAGTTYTMDLRAAGAGTGSLNDSYLSLYDASGTRLAYDDDSGPSLDSSLSFTASASGTYYLEARGFSSATGTYEVAVSPSAIAASTALEIKEGTSGADTLVGGDGSQIILGYAGDDLLTGGAGNDRIEGGEGDDTAVFSGAEADYNVEIKSDRLVITHLTGTDGTDTLIGVEKLAFSDKTVTVTSIAAAASSGATAGADTLSPSFSGLIDGGAGTDSMTFSGARGAFTVSNSNGFLSVTGSSGTQQLANVERLSFADGVLAFDITGTAGQAYRLYEAALNRTPDSGGLGFHIGSLDGGAALSAVANTFINSPEFQARYGALTDDGFVTAIYQNVLDRAPDDGGKAFWVNSLASGASRADVLAGFSESNENKAGTAAQVADGIFYTLS